MVRQFDMWVMNAFLHAMCGINTTSHNFYVGDLSVVWNAKLQNSEDLAYGVDWKKDCNIIATCSFYNHSMQLWRLVL